MRSKKGTTPFSVKVKERSYRLGLMVSLLLVAWLINIGKTKAQNNIPAPGSIAESPTPVREFDNLPVYFRKNIGQWNEDILFQGSSPGWGANVYFMKDRLSFCATREKENYSREEKNEEYESVVWNLYFKNTNPGVSISAEGESGSHTNYIVGRDESKYKTNVPDYKLISYKNIYDHVTVNYYSTGKNLKYDYILYPGANMDNIQGSFEGIHDLQINSKGNLEIHTTWGTIVEDLPESYQIVNGEKRNVLIEYALVNPKTFGFKIKGGYDRSVPLVIDPVTLKWCTYVGGTLTSCAAYVLDIATNATGDIYGTGWANNNFPTTAGVYDNSFNGSFSATPAVGDINPPGDVYVFKMNSTGTALLWSTYIGGNQSDHGEGIALNAAGDIFVTGWTRSSNFPAVNAYNNTYGGAASPSASLFMSPGDAFAFKLNSNGTALTYSTFIGGPNNDWANDIVINVADEAYITGATESSSFPTTAGALYTTFNGVSDAFFCKLNSTGNTLLYSTFLGGTQFDVGLGLTIDNTNAVYITGATSSADFPVTGSAYDNSFNGVSDIFVTKITAAFTLVYSTYIGGSASEGPGFYPYGMAKNKIVVNTSGQTFVTGTTTSSDFPVVNAYDNTFNGGGGFGGGDVFVFKLNNAGNNLIYSTYIGGAFNDSGNDLIVNNMDEVYVVGGTNSANFPTTPCAYDVTYNGGGPYGDIFFLKLDASGNNLQYSTFFGGSHNQEYYPIIKLVNTSACMPDVIIGLTSHSGDIPTTPGVYKQNPVPPLPPPSGANSYPDMPVLLRFTPVIKSGFTFPSSVCKNTPVQFTDTTNHCGLFNALRTSYWDFGDGTTASIQNPTHAYSSAGNYNVKLVVSCPMDSITKTISIVAAPCGVTVTATTTAVCSGSCTSVTSSPSGGTGPYLYSWSTGATTQNINVCPASITTYTVKVTDAGANTATATTTVTVNPSVSITATSSVACSAANGSAVANPVGGSTPYMYVWSNGQSAQTATSLVSGNYSVTVVDSKGCTSTAITTIDPPLAAQFIKGAANCTGCGCKEWIMVMASDGTSPYSYSWSALGGITKRYQNKLCPGNYTIKVTDKNGCNVNVSVNAP
jgi:hypothetical protein